MKSNTLGVTLAACICFARAAASLLAGMIHYHDCRSVPAFVAAILLMIGLACRSTLLLSAGALMRIVVALYALLEDHGIYMVFCRTSLLLLRAIMTLAAGALLLALALSRRRCVLLGWLSGAFTLLSAILYYYGWANPAAQHTSVQAFSAVSILLNFAAILAPIFAGYARREMPTFRAAWGKLMDK